MPAPMPPPLRSIPRVCDVTRVRGARAPADAVPDVLLEVPHGATKAEHFASLRADLVGSYPDDLRDFFFVNTDVGAPEVAERLAARLVADDPTRTALVVRCRLPRTFVDCNRVIAPDAVGAPSGAGAMTPGLMPWVTHPADRTLLLERYAAYRALVTNAVETVMGARGLALFVHTYAPRSVDVAVDEHVVASLREAYRPEVVDRWPLRPEVDLITRDPDGRRLADEGLVAALHAAFAAAGVGSTEDHAYTLQPSTMAAVHAARFPGRTLCFEMRRDLLVAEFTPFAEMGVDPAAAERMAGILAGPVGAWMRAAARVSGAGS